MCASDISGDSKGVCAGHAESLWRPRNDGISGGLSIVVHHPSSGAKFMCADLRQADSTFTGRVHALGDGTDNADAAAGASKGMHHHHMPFLGLNRVCQYLGAVLHAVNVSQMCTSPVLTRDAIGA